MKHWFTPTTFHLVAVTCSPYRWRLLAWSAFALLLFVILETQMAKTTPDSLVWIALLILFSALQSLVLASFIFFFQTLPSTLARGRYWLKFHLIVEWGETLLFTILLPLPALIYLYALFSISGIGFS